MTIRRKYFFEDLKELREKMLEKYNKTNDQKALQTIRAIDKILEVK